MRPKPRQDKSAVVTVVSDQTGYDFAKLHVVVTVVGWSRSDGSARFVHTAPAIRHGTCRLSGVYSHLLGQ